MFHKVYTYTCESEPRPTAIPQQYPPQPQMQMQMQMQAEAPLMRGVSGLPSYAFPPNQPVQPPLPFQQPLQRQQFQQQQFQQQQQSMAFGVPPGYGAPQPDFSRAPARPSGAVLQQAQPTQMPGGGGPPKGPYTSSTSKRTMVGSNFTPGPTSKGFNM